MECYYLFKPSYSYKETGIKDDSQIILEPRSKNAKNVELYKILSGFNVNVFGELDRLEYLHLNAKFHKNAKHTNISNYRRHFLHCPFAIDDFALSVLLKTRNFDFKFIDLIISDDLLYNYKLLVFPLQDDDAFIDYSSSNIRNISTNEKVELNNFDSYNSCLKMGNNLECSMITISKEYAGMDMFNFKLFPYIIVSERLIDLFVKMDVSGFDYDDSPVFVEFR